MARPKLSNRNTKAELVQAAKEIILTKGFHAFTYEDLADRVKIRKASIHYYFPSKVDLGVYILNSGIERLDSFFQSLKNQKLPPLQQLKVYFDFLLSSSEAGTKVCLCGSFSVIWPLLPGRVQTALKKLMSVQIEWLKAIIEQGRKRGAIAKIGPVREQAQLVFSSLQGGLQTARVQGDPVYFQSVTKQLLNSLKRR